VGAAVTRRQTIWLTALSILLVVKAWRFTSAAIASQPGWWTPVSVPILLGVASMGLIIYGWHAAVSGPFALAGAGMLVEISRGQGWRFTRRLSYGLILGGGALTLRLSMLSASGLVLSANSNQLHMIYPREDGLIEIAQIVLG